MVGLAALKYGDIRSNQAAKDYSFDIDRFTSFEGDAGPYILYTIVRIKSVLAKYQEQGKTPENTQALVRLSARTEKALMVAQIAKFNTMMEAAFTECGASQRYCAYIYDLANAFNRFCQS